VHIYACPSIHPTCAYHIHSLEHVSRFTFKYIDAAQWEKPFVIIMDVSTSRFKAVSCQPMIPNLARLLDTLNEDNNFYGFLWNVRAGFVSSCNK